jgi:hypothetical protein
MKVETGLRQDDALERVLGLRSAVLVALGLPGYWYWGKREQ